ncbi:MAG: hypothetical protein K2I30_06600 [Clostridia bacterium]|nr:hypothetical protein [Clostridia bacterium]
MALWVIVLIVTVAAFVAIRGFLLPRIFLRGEYGRLALSDRGYGIADEENGRSVVYEPDVKIRKQIKKYVLSQRGGVNQLVLRLDESIKHIDFDVAVYNESGAVFKVLNVREIVENAGYTKALNLPPQTSFVTVKLNAVNGESESRGLFAGGVKVSMLAVYIALSCLTDVVCVLFAKVCAAKLFGGLFGESFLLLGKSWGLTAAVCAAVIVLDVIFTVFTLWFKYGRKTSKGADDAGL